MSPGGSSQAFHPIGTAPRPKMRAMARCSRTRARKERVKSTTRGNRQNIVPVNVPLLGSLAAIWEVTLVVVPMASQSLHRPKLSLN